MVLMIWLRGNYWEKRTANFCEGGREVALYSGPRSSSDGVRQSLQRSKGEWGEWGRCDASAVGSQKLRELLSEGFHTGPERALLPVPDIFWGACIIYLWSLAPSWDRHSTPLRLTNGSVPELGPGAQTSTLPVIMHILLKYVTIISPQTELFNIRTTNIFWEWALSQSVEMEQSRLCSEGMSHEELMFWCWCCQWVWTSGTERQLNTMSGSP